MLTGIIFISNKAYFTRSLLAIYRKKASCNYLWNDFTLLKNFFASQKLCLFVCLLVEKLLSGKAGGAPADFTGTSLSKVYQCSHSLLKKEESIFVLLAFVPYAEKIK